MFGDDLSLILLLGAAVFLLFAVSALILTARLPRVDEAEPPAPPTLLRILRDDHRSRHRGGIPRGLRGAERWL